MNQKIVFFDGHCNLCNRSVDTLLRLDRHQKLRFAPLSGATAKDLGLVQAQMPSEQSIIFYKDSAHIYSRSDAVLEIISELSIWGKSVRIFRIIPRPIRDSIYRLIAKYRYSIFGRRQTCRIATPEERMRFLD